MRTAIRPNLVHAEFFLVGRNAASLEALMVECLERTADGSPIKVVVRFFDEDHVLTDFALRAEGIRGYYEKKRGAFFKSTGLRRWVLSLQCRCAVGKVRKIRKEKRQLATTCLRRAIQGKQSVVIEQTDRSFRIVRGDEKHDLLEAIARSTSVWLFVFAHNDLFADTNVTIASVM